MLCFQTDLKLSKHLSFHLSRNASARNRASSDLTDRWATCCFTALLTISVISSQRKADYERLYVVEHCLRLNEIPVPVRFKSRLLAIAGQD